ncbi:MBL fold metallo-hydrolase [Paracoccus albus]|uniref:MBL fold metallo-hydrolase n=1 Tax=Paracoccus albus TaxID=3017784 RepID=UPI0022F0A9DB|nr:MBL fold metallo-hydrolase [Paracoccus albus]WBU62324.1 MBL fold metallo-hydrolase [Paracoccus albus]
MTNDASQAREPLTFPFQDVPEFGDPVEIAEGIIWVRFPLPFALDHVNVYFIRDGEGWAVIDTGINTKPAIATWQAVLRDVLRGEPITRVIATHVHPDHIGLAGWLCERFDAPLLTSLSSYSESRLISLAPNETGSRQFFDFYVSHGMTAEGAGIVAIRGNEYLQLVYPLPRSYHRLVRADVLNIGHREFRVVTGEGHAAEQIMLYCHEESLLFCADQVLERISPNVSVSATDPNGDPLGHFLRSLRQLRQDIPAEVLVLPGHRRPFHGLHTRAAELEEHHEQRCDLIRRACTVAPQTVADLVPVLFPRKLDAHQMSFAFTETLAHVNRLVRRGELDPVQQDGLLAHRTSASI